VRFLHAGRRIPQPAPRAELEHELPGAVQLALERRPAAHEIPRALLRLGRDGNQDQVTTPIEVGELLGIVAIVLALVPGATRRERGRADVAVIAPTFDGALEHVPRAARLVHAAELCAVAREAIEVALQAAEVVRQRIDLLRRGRRVGKHRTDDGLLVHIKAEMENTRRRGRHGLALLVL
jgi:hypothetical protein